MSKKLFVFIFVMLLNGCRSTKASSYTAAVVELNPHSLGDGLTSTNAVLKQVVDIIHSKEIKTVDIVVFPEAILNHATTAILLPNSTLFCDDPSAHFVLRNISCAVRDVQKYVVIDLNIKIKCSEDDQPFCAYKADSTNLYNMAMVFNRHGEIIAKYRKYHLFNEHRVQHPTKADVITFHTDFNVTFGVFICFDLMFAEPAQTLIERGVKHFVYPTMWFSELPYLTAAQFQQSWAYANDVTFLAANVNFPTMALSGSGIYAGRLGALKVFVSQSATSKILIAKVPIEREINSIGTCDNEIDVPANCQSTQQNSELFENDGDGVSGSILEASRRMSDEDLMLETDLYQDDLTNYTVSFLDFSSNSGQRGTICHVGLCCNYDFDVTDHGEQAGKTSYVYAIAVFNGQRYFPLFKDISVGVSVCSLIACTEMDSKKSCGKRIPVQQAHNRYTFKKLVLQTEIPISKMNIVPNTLNTDLLPMAATEFEYDISKLDAKDKYAVKIALKKSKSNLMTFAIYSRNYDNDVVNNAP